VGVSAWKSPARGQAQSVVLTKAAACAKGRELGIEKSKGGAARHPEVRHATWLA
jgi:hypothetical protein